MKYSLLFLVLCTVAACAPSRFVKPLNKGEQAVTAHIGGAMVNELGTTFPLPLTSVAYGRGFSNELTGFASLHTTALFFGVVQTEIGATRSILKPDSSRYFSPGFSISPVANVMLDTWEGQHRFYPQLDANAYWTFGKHESFAYIGLSQWFELHGTRAHGEKQETRWLWNPQAGATWVCEKMQYGIEAKWLAPNHSNEAVVVDYFKPFGKKGTTGVYITFTRKF